jgi:hypothetical protein
VATLNIRFCDQLDGGFGWVVDEFMERCSHALVDEGRVWLVDPLDGEGVEERIRASGTPAGVIQLLDRHNRDCAELARRLRVPHHFVSTQAVGPFELRRIRNGRWWKEVALWWPERRVLVAADALGTAPYFCARGERLGVHPALRLSPPRRQLAGLTPAAVLCGHGEGILDDADEVLRGALSSARRRIPAQLASAVRAWRARPTSSR